MSDIEALSEPKRRSAGFPVLSLRDSVEMVVAAGMRGGADHSHNAFATYLGHSTSNSGPYRKKLAALRDWGLISRGGDRISYTPLARDFIREAPRHAEAHELLRQAFMNCAPFAALFNDSAKGMGLDRSRLRAAAMMDIGVSADSADRFVDSFVDSVTAAGLGEPTENGGIILGGSPTSDAIEEDSDGAATAMRLPVPVPADYPVLRPGPTRRAETAASVEPAVHQVWAWDTGDMMFLVRSDLPLPAASFARIGEVVEKITALAEDLQRSAERSGALALPAGGQTDE